MSRVPFRCQLQYEQEMCSLAAVVLRVHHLPNETYESQLSVILIALQQLVAFFRESLIDMHEPGSQSLWLVAKGLKRKHSLEWN